MLPRPSPPKSERPLSNNKAVEPNGVSFTLSFIKPYNGSPRNKRLYRSEAAEYNTFNPGRGGTVTGIKIQQRKYISIYINTQPGGAADSVFFFFFFLQRDQGGRGRNL